MAWWRRERGPRPEYATFTANPGRTRVADRPALTAAAAPIDTTSRRHSTGFVQPWQEEAWQYYDELGEFRYGVEWLAGALSRVRLRAAEIQPGQDEPKIVDKGSAAELVSALCDGVSGRAQMMARLATLITVPGEGLLLGETPGAGAAERWTVLSLDEIRGRGGASAVAGGPATSGLEVLDAAKTLPGREQVWRPVAANHLLTRIWRPHARWSHLADSPARPARPILRELELVNRHIVAQYLSRLASAGMIVLPLELDFPVREEYQGLANGFVLEWLALAREAIQTPGSAAAAVPMPIQVPGEYTEKVKFIDFTTAMDRDIILKRDSVIRRLATEMSMPSEALLGMGDTNHWSAWQLEESGIKLHVAPPCETICHSLTVGYLRPRLEAGGEDPTRWVVWYDTSELTQRPDRSTNAQAAYDRMELSGKALRRETGFDEDDAPNPAELQEMLLRKAATYDLQGVALALEKLAKLDVRDSITVSGAGPDGQGDEQTGDTQGDPKDRKDPPADEGVPEREAPPVRAASAVPLLPAGPLRPSDVEAHRISLDFGGGQRVHHPAECQHRPAGCPVTWAAFYRDLPGPGTPGRYRLTLVDGHLAIGERVLSDQGDGAEPTRVR